MKICNKGWVLWFTGISGAGKTTLTQRVHEELASANIHTALLDGDVVRGFFEDGLGYERAHRMANIKRIAFVAQQLSENGVHTLVANMAPYVEARDFIRRKIPNYLQIYVKANLSEVMKRDVKGHYRRFQSLEMSHVVGLDDPYEEPRHPDLVIDTNVETIEDSLQKVMVFLQEKRIFL